MVRTPCCKSEGLKKGAWTPEEDQKLTAYIQEHGEGGWRTLPEKAGLKRCGKSCRLRWANYLRPDIKRGQFSREDEETIIKLHAIKGNKWSAIARSLPGRTDNEIKNYWNTHIKKRLLQKGIDPTSHKSINPGSDREETGITESPNSVSVSVSGSAPSLVSGSVQLLNLVASKFAVNVNRNFLAEIIQGGDKKNSNSVVCRLLNKMTTRSDVLKSFMGTNICVENRYSSMPTSSFSDEALEVTRHDSDSTGTTDPVNYCTDTPSDDFPGVPIEPNGSENFDTSWESVVEDHPFKCADSLNKFEDEKFFEATNAESFGFMEELKNIVSDDQNIMGQDSEEKGCCWNDYLDLEDYSLLGSSLF